jgi:hypothetical protein
MPDGQIIADEKPIDVLKDIPVIGPEALSEHGSALVNAIETQHFDDFFQGTGIPSVVCAFAFREQRQRSGKGNQGQSYPV